MSKVKTSISVLLTALLMVSVFALGCPPPEVVEPVEPIRVGVATAVTGVLADDGRHHVRALQMAVDEINARGGLLGRPVELVVADVGDNTPPELVAARDLLKAADVDVINSNWFKIPGTMLYLLEVGVLVTHHGWGLLEWQTWWDVRDEFPYFMVLNRDESGYGVPYAQALTNPEMIPFEFPSKTAVVLSTDTVYNLNIAGWWIPEMERLGWEIVLHEIHPIGHVEFGPQFERIRALDPPPGIVFINSVISEEVIPAFSEFLAAPTQSLVAMLWMVEKPEFLDAFGELADGVIGTLPGWHFHASTYRGENPQFITHYEEGKALREAYLQRWDEVPSVQVPIAWDSFWAWAKAVERVGDVRDFGAIMDAMFDYPFIGTVGRHVFDRETHAGTHGFDRLPIMYFQVQGGEVRTLAVGEGRDVEHIDPFVLPHWIER